MEAIVEIVIMVLLTLQCIPAKWILSSPGKDVPPKRNVALLSLGLLGLELATLMFVGCMAFLADPEGLMEGLPMVVLMSGGPAGLLAIIIVRICKDRSVVAGMSQQERRIHWIDLGLKIGVMLVPIWAGAWAFLAILDEGSEYPVLGWIVLLIILAELLLLICRLALSGCLDKWVRKDLTQEDKVDRKVRSRYSKKWLETLTPEQYDALKAKIRVEEEGRIGRKYGVWAENDYEPLPAAETPKDDVKKE